MNLRRITPFVLIFVITVLLGWYFSNILLYLVISLVLSTILRTVTDRINKMQIFEVNVPRFIAVFISFILLISLMSLFVVLFVPLISEQIEILSEVNYDQIFNRITQPFHLLESFLIENNFIEAEYGFITEQIQSSVMSMISQVDFRLIFNNALTFATNFIIGVIAVTFITFFLLYEDGILKRWFIAMIPNKYFEVMIAVLYKIEKLLSNYLLGLLFQMISIFSIVAIGLTLVGIKYALTIALFAAIANLIPYIGPLLGATFGIIVGLSTGSTSFDNNAYLFLILKIIAVFGVVQLIDNIFLQPIIFSKSVKAHPLEIFVVIFAGATIAGVVGMIAAIPVYTILRVSAIELFEGYRSYHIFKS